MAKLDRFIIDNTTYELVPEIAPLFNPATPYSVGDCVIHDAVLYKFTANHAAGAWTGNDVVAFEVGSELVRLGNGTSGSGLTEAVKVALLACFEKVAWIDEDGQDYYDALYNALYPPADLVSVSAVFTQGSAVIYDTDSLDTLKQYLVVTAHMSDSSTRTVTNYVLSGTLSAGTSTITVTYGGKTTTFNVSVVSSVTYLFNLGDECSSITGGWDVGVGFVVDAGKFSATKESDCLDISTTSVASGAIAQSISTHNTIDLSGYTKLGFDVSTFKQSGSGNAWVYYPLTIATSNNQATAYGSDNSSYRNQLQYDTSVTAEIWDGTRHVREIDISSINDSRYISINLNVWSNAPIGTYFKVHRVYVR